MFSFLIQISFYIVNPRYKNTHILANLPIQNISGELEYKRKVLSIDYFVIISANVISEYLFAKLKDIKISIRS